MKLLNKIISILLILTFLLYDLTPREALGQEVKIISPIQGSEAFSPLSIENGSIQKSLDRVEIPHDIGEVVEKSEIKGRPLVFIIEDIHCHTEAQRNIARILKQLEAKSELEARGSKLEAKAKTEEVFTLSLEPRASSRVLSSSLQPRASSQSFYVLSEAASGPINMQFFWSFPDKKILREASQKFLENHKINGVEAFLINSDSHKVEGIGIEETNAYIENVKSMGELLEAQESEESEWIKIQETIKNLRQKIYPKELIELIEKREEYREFKMDLGEYVKQLEANDGLKARGSKLEAKAKNQTAENQSLPLSSSSLELRASSQNYPQLGLYVQLQALEKKMDASKIESEYLTFLSELEKKLPKEELSEVLRNVLEHRLGRISDEKHYLCLSRYLEPEDEENVSPLKLRGAGGVMEEVNNPTDSPYIKGREKQEEKKLYPNLQLLIQQMSLMKQISWSELEKEVEKRADNAERLAYRGKENEKEIKKLLRLEKDFALLKRVISMEGSREDLRIADFGLRIAELKKKERMDDGRSTKDDEKTMEEERGRKDAEEPDSSIVFRSSFMVLRLSSFSPHPSFLVSPSSLQPLASSQIGPNNFIRDFIIQLGKLAKKEAIDYESPNLSGIFNTAQKFYAKVLERDEIFQGKIQKIIQEKNLKSVALVAGGFHTEGIKAKLKAAHIGYWVIAPHTSKIEDRSIYFRKMKEFFSVSKGDGEEPGDALGDPTLSLEAQVAPEHLQTRLIEFIQVFKALIEVSQKNKEGNTTAAFAVNQILARWTHQAGPFAALIRETFEGLQLNEESERFLEGLRGNLTSETPATRALALATLDRLVPDLATRNLLFQRMGLEGEEDLTQLLETARQNAESLQAALRGLSDDEDGSSDSHQPLQGLRLQLPKSLNPIELSSQLSILLKSLHGSNDGGGGGPSDNHQHSQEWPSPLQKLPNQQELPFHLSSLCESLLGYTNTPPTSTTAPNDSTATLVQSLNAINASLIAPAVSSSTAMFTSAPPSTSLRESLSQFIQLSRALIQMLKQAPGEINGITQAQTGYTPLGLMPWFYNLLDRFGVPDEKKTQWSGVEEIGFTGILMEGLAWLLHLTLGLDLMSGRAIGLALGAILFPLAHWEGLYFWEDGKLEFKSREKFAPGDFAKALAKLSGAGLVIRLLALLSIAVAASLTSPIVSSTLVILTAGILHSLYSTKFTRRFTSFPTGMAGGERDQPKNVINQDLI
ncbi:MAG: hypothetical protein HYZ66_01195, partial [Chlamydiae bacterium]|nr:hypothetical protein [Chlamydiota bacterium]